ncbi:hypothetical protein ABEG63_06035 [Chryseobacterium sp. C39-AII1]|uniref:hypothetical protein n=1 Tax=Chryseobacterium sp. C39-AII1 TaxID=3080332 RepID=UPI0032086817
MSFKLIAIRPLTDCDPKFLKNLEENKVYKFYDNYIFKFKHTNINNEIKSVKYKPTIPENLYNQGKLNINISAIVGKNGSGKSTLMELLYLGFFYLSTLIDLLEIDNIKNTSKNLQFEDNGTVIKNLLSFFQSDFYSTEYNLRNKNLSDLNNIDTKDVLRIIKHFSDELRRYKLNPNENFVSIGRLRLEIIYTFDDIAFYNLKLDNDEQFKDQKDKLYSLKIIGEDENLSLKGNEEKSKYLFYNLGVNYSHYALNSKDIGNWINSLFHKNDSYQAPIVLNPMRTDGIININNENYLVRSRMLSNILIQNSLRELAPKKIVKKILLKIDKEKFEIRDFDENFMNILQSILKKSVSNSNFYNSQDSLNIKKYIYRKFSSILTNYKKYINKYNSSIESLNKEKIEDFIITVLEDDSHVTLKLKQAIYHLHIGYYFLEDKNYIIEDLNEYTSYLKENNPFNFRLIEQILPSFYSVDYLFEDESSFNNMSSGEKQKIHSLSSLVYHLRNIDSVNNKKKNKKALIDKKDEIIKYKNVNLIFDEIELYYHPELQRTFINDLLQYIDNAKLSDIKSVNCIFITHSPFILSDIPTQNIMFLETEEKKVANENGIEEIKKISVQKKNLNKTFAANIHDLLADSFFMQNGYLGEFAKLKIKEVISYLSKRRKETDKWNKENVKIFIDQIGEPLLKDSLNELYYIKFPEEIEKEIKRLKKIKNKL